MKVQLLVPFDGYEALYIDGKQVLSGHSLYVEDVLRAVCGDENVDIFNYGEYEEEDFKTIEEKDGGWSLEYEGATIWVNGKGCPEQYPFEF